MLDLKQNNHENQPCISHIIDQTGKVYKLGKP